MTVAPTHEPPPRVFASPDLDWRLLLPPPPDGGHGRLLLLGASAETVAEVEAVGLAREVATALDGRRAGVVACLAGAGLTLEQAAALVGEGGVLYYESAVGMQIRLRRSLSAIERSLRRTGLALTGLYWVHPGFTGPRTYFPIEVEGALRWYLRTLRGSTTPVAGVDRGLDLLARLEPRKLARLAPRLAVFATKDACTGSSIAFPDDQLPQPLRGRDLRPLLLVHGSESTHAVMLPFDATSPEPLAVLKVRRRAGRGPAADVLARVRGAVDEPVRAAIPEPLGVAHSGDLAATVESFLPGQWLRARLSRRRLPLGEAIEDLDLAIDWIEELHARYPLERRSWSDRDLAELDDAADAFERAVGATEVERELLAELRRRATDLVGAKLPVVWRHGDFSSLNVLRHGRRIGVVDWEMAGPGLPLDDPLHFARLWLYLVRKADRPATFVAFRDLFLRLDHHDAAVDAARAAIARYVARLDLDVRFVPIMLVAGCVRRARARAEGRAALRGQPADPRERNRYVTYLDLVAQDASERFWSADTWSPAR